MNALLPLPGDGMLAGAKPAVTPAGRPLADRATADWNPPVTAVVKVTAADPPVDTVLPDALALNDKPGTITVRLNGCVLMSPPPDAVIVRL